MARFNLTSSFKPGGDQINAISRLKEGISKGERYQVLLGVTGSGKTFTMANIIEFLGLPTLVISHNKTLAAQLYSEFREFFPDNAVHYFVSYYDYYQPEAYIPQRDIYIEKDASINDNIDRLRLAATSALMQRDDVIIVASVSCIYGLGSPEDYQRMLLEIKAGEHKERDVILKRLVDIQYERNDTVLERSHFRVRGDIVEIYPSYEETAYRVELLDDRIESITKINPVTNQNLGSYSSLTIYPAKHFVMPEERIYDAAGGIELELKERLEVLRKENKFLEAQRLEARTRYDMEMLREIGYCPGIENYSRHLGGRMPGERPYTLVDYFPGNFLTIVDESHAAIPQLRGMYEGDRSRKQTLVDHGFRLPSALDNRPMKFSEWEDAQSMVIFVSATPGPYELKKAEGNIIEQVIRPTGLLDPVIHIRPSRNQMEDLLEEIRKRVKSGERALVTTITKSLAEDLSQYILRQGIKCHYLHSEIETIERVKILNELRSGAFDVIVGVNLLREGLDLPEVSLVAILDADKEGFLRSETALIQTIGRTARNINAEVILYGDEVTPSMKRAVDETERRRRIQLEYNKTYNITPETIIKGIRKGIEEELRAGNIPCQIVGEEREAYVTREYLAELEGEMMQAAKDLNFELAATIRDRIFELKGEKDKILAVNTRKKKGYRGNK